MFNRSLDILFQLFLLFLIYKKLTDHRNSNPYALQLFLSCYQYHQNYIISFLRLHSQHAGFIGGDAEATVRDSTAWPRSHVSTLPEACQWRALYPRSGRTTGHRLFQAVWRSLLATHKTHPLWVALPPLQKCKGAKAVKYIFSYPWLSLPNVNVIAVLVYLVSNEEKGYGISKESCSDLLCSFYVFFFLSRAR